jgi:hypothetical protein
MPSTENRAAKRPARTAIASVIVAAAALLSGLPASADPNRKPTPTAAATPAAPVTPTPAERLRVAPSASRADSVVLVWTGRVEAGMADAIAKAFDQHKATTRRVLLTIDSGGGSVNEGRRVIDVLKRIRDTHQLDTYVKPGSRCGSMCVPIYLQGQTRYAATSSLWLFHEVSIRDLKTKQITKLDRPAFQQLVDDYFIPAGVSKDWLADMMPKTEGADYWRTGEALIREKSNIIHKATSDTNQRTVVEKAASQ